MIVAFNRARLLRRSLERLRHLTVPEQIIVVDDGGTDVTREVCRAYEMLGMPIWYVYNNRPEWGNRCQPTNAGIKLANHELVMLTDPEVEFLTDVVAQFRVVAAAHPSDILAPWTGYHDTSEGCSLGECLVAEPGNGLHDNGGNVFLYRKSWIEEIGGWDEQLGPGGFDDVDFHMRLSWRSHRQVAIPGVEIRHRWHDPIPWNAGEEQAQPSSLRNKEIVEAKRFPEDLVANQGREWGKLLV